MHAIGIDIGGSSVKGAAIDADGEEAGLARSASYDDALANEGDMKAAVRESVRDVLSALGEPGGCHVGVCAPGAMRSGVVAQSVNLPELVGLDIAGMIDELIPSARSLWLLSDAYAGAFDLFQRRAATGDDTGRLAAISIGTGVGLSVLDHGAPLDIGGGTSGRVGQIDVSLDREAPIGPDGGKGSLEAYIGAGALRRRLGRDALDDPDRLAKALDADDAPLRALARAVRILHAIYRPQQIVLIGGVGIMLAPHLAQLDALVRDGLTSVAAPDWRLETGVTLHHAALGAAKFASGAGGA
jgi:glucokinase